MPEPGTDFERLVADFCGRVWNPDHIKINRMIEGRELDIQIESDEELVLIECTIERGKKKAEGDISKIRDMRKAILGDAAHKKVRGYFITQHDPSPEVHKVAEENGLWIEACSFPAFINKHNCSSTYLLERGKSQFGSVRNPADETVKLMRNQYIEVPLRAVGTSQDISLGRIFQDVLGGQQAVRMILTGDFGIGKSMTFRELYFRLAEAYATGLTYRFPMYINLKDGAFDENDDAIDLIERHAKWINLRSQRDKLVHAWKSDCCTLFLDGFDEVVSSGFDRITSPRSLRFASGHIVREIVRDSHRNTSIFISGRESYHSDFAEMRECLQAGKFMHVSLHDLNEKEVQQLYRKILPSGNPIIFGWLPQRPLLLSYLYFAFGDELKKVHEISSGISPGEGWQTLLDRLAAREAEVAKKASPTQIRRLLDRVALYGRTTATEPSRVTSVQFNQAYHEIFETLPQTSVLPVLMRLPGLSTGGATEDRGFIDVNFFDAAQAGTVVEFIEALGTRDPKALRTDNMRPIVELLRKTRSTISALSAQVAIAALRKRNQLGVLGVALQEALSIPELSECNVVGDIFMCALEQPQIGFRDDLNFVNIGGTYFSEVELTADAIAGKVISFNDCIFDRLELDLDPATLGKVRFQSSHVGHLVCSEEVAERLDEIGLHGTVERTSLFDAGNSDILSLNVSNYRKAIKIVLKKLFREHRAAGRVRSTFFRGIGSLKREFIERALLALAGHRLIFVLGNPALPSSVWHANRAQSTRANMLIDAHVSNDVVFSELEAG
jgi:hypothetical protein